MSITGIGSISTPNALTALNNTSNPDSTSAAQGTTSTAAASTTVSKPGELMAKLSQLLQQDPAKFKQVTAQIADDLKTAATNAGGPQAQFLSKLSDDFAQASSSGTMASLKPQGGREHSGAVHHHQGGGHHDGGGAGGGMEAVLSNALNEVNQALNGTTVGSGASPAGSF